MSFTPHPPSSSRQDEEEVLVEEIDRGGGGKLSVIQRGATAPAVFIPDSPGGITCCLHCDRKTSPNKDEETVTIHPQCPIYCTCRVTSSGEKSCASIQNKKSSV